MIDLLIDHTEDGSAKVQKQLADNTVWITQADMVALFHTTKQKLSLHIRNIFEGGRLDEFSVVKEYLTTTADGKNYRTKYYNLDVIISEPDPNSFLPSSISHQGVRTDHPLERIRPGGRMFAAPTGRSPEAEHTLSFIVIFRFMKAVTNTLLLIAMIIAGSAHAQIAWHRSYGLPNIDEALQFVYPAEEPGYFWAAGITSSFGQDDWLVVKLDTNGQVVWADTIGSPMDNEFLWSFHREPATGDMWLAGSKTNFSNTKT